MSGWPRFVETCWPAILVALAYDVSNPGTNGSNRIIEQTKPVGWIEPLCYRSEHQPEQLRAEIPLAAALRGRVGPDQTTTTS
jgi:hypothetical protein